MGNEQQRPESGNPALDFVEHRGRAMRAGWPERIEAAQAETHYSIGGRSYARVAYGSEPGVKLPEDASCPDCGAAPGELHVSGCDLERCPACGKSAVGCSCPYD